MIREENDFEIVKTSLDTETCKQGMLVKKYCNQHARNSGLRNRLENERIILIAEMKDKVTEKTEEIRIASAKKKLFYRRGGASELPKITDKALEDLINGDDSINELCQQLNVAKSEFELAKAKSQELIDAEFNEMVSDGAKRAILAKGMSLQDTVKLYLNNYYANEESYALNTQTTNKEDK